MDISAEDFPPSLVQMVEVIGFRATLKLVENWGGIYLYVPRKIGSDHEIARHIGQAAATKLSRHYGDDEISIPRAAAALRGARNRRILDEADNKTAARQAREHGMTERQIFWIRAHARQEKESPQVSLFTEE